MRLLLLALTLLSLSSAAANDAANAPPNILFFLVDDQRNDTLGCAGHSIVQTPHIDELARRGTRFENAMVTTPICWVSRATLLSGMWSRTHGSAEQIDRLSKEATRTLYPRVLERHGYRNGFFGKWDARMPPEVSRQEGFESYEEILRNPYFKELDDGTLRHETDLIADRGIDFLRSHPDGQPFCLNLWFNAAHAEDGDLRPGIGHYPWPPSTDGMYEDTEIPPPRLSDPKIFQSQPQFLKDSLNRTRFFWRWDTPEKYATNMRAYYRMLTGIDHAIGRVVQVLRQRGLDQNTIIIYSADNGYYMGDRGFAGKWSHYEQSLRVPLIIVDPRIPSDAIAAESDRVVLNVDLPATILDFAGAEIPPAYQGHSLRPLMSTASAETADWRTEFFAEHLVEMGTRIPKWEGVRGERYVYAHYFENEFEFLHDLHEDPDQLRNLASDTDHQSLLAQYRERCARLRETLTAARAETVDPAPQTPPTE